MSKLTTFGIYSLRAPQPVRERQHKSVRANYNKIGNGIESLFTDENEYMKMSKAHNPYGDGEAIKRIVEKLLKFN